MAQAIRNSMSCNHPTRDDCKRKQTQPAASKNFSSHPAHSQLPHNRQRRAVPSLRADAAALEDWRRVQHLQFQAFAATTVGTPPTTLQGWHRRNASVNRIALVCKGECPRIAVLALDSVVVCAQIGGRQSRRKMSRSLTADFAGALQSLRLSLRQTCVNGGLL